jgi:peptidoglycan/LPS O-acetylase OafA/YrhL
MRNPKNLFFFICTIILFVLFMTTVAIADDASIAEPARNYLTWEFLGTMYGATAAVLLIIQFIKAPLDKLWKIPTRYVVYVISLLILLSVEYVLTGTLTFDRTGLILLNAVVVAMAAMGTYEATFRKVENKQKDTPG